MALEGGTRLTPDNLEVTDIVVDDAPDGAVADPDLLVGRTLAAPVPRGQVMTERAVVSARASPGRVMAPLRLADADVTALLGLVTWWTCLPPTHKPSRHSWPVGVSEW